MYVRISLKEMKSLGRIAEGVAARRGRSNLNKPHIKANGSRSLPLDVSVTGV